MNELENKVEQLRELRRMQEELAAEIAATEDSLKAYMTANGADELHGHSFKITWKEKPQPGDSSQSAKRQGQGERHTAALDPLRPASCNVTKGRLSRPT